MRRSVKTIQNEELLESLDDNSILIDVREIYEYKAESIPQAINIPLGDISKEAKNLDKNKVYYIICRSGNRSEQAVKILIKQGFKYVYNVLPGMSKWKK